MGLKFISEDDNDYQLEKTTKQNIFTRLRLIFLFSTFLVIIFLLIKNDYSLAFGEKDQLEFVCGPKNTLNLSNDDQDMRGEKILRAIAANEELLAEIPGFEKIYSAKEPLGYQKRDVFVAKIIFSADDPQQKKIPDQLCGFNLNLIYK